MIKTILFDIGQVVVKTDFNAIYADFAQRVGLSTEFLIAYHKDNFDDLLLGTITLEQFWTDMRNAGANPALDLSSVWIDAARKNRTVNEELLSIIKKLREKYSVGALTNLSPARLLVDESMNLYSHFDYAMLSCREHLKKPDPKFYQLGLTAANAQVSEAIFVDDQERYIKGAEAYGIKSIAYHYPDNATLLQNLREFNVAIS
jgi:putative hydrolase of the HAD superfamily